MLTFTWKVLATLAAAASVCATPSDHQHATRQAAKYEGYVFAYFTGNTIEGEKIYLAASNGNNALDWKELNGGKPILSSSQGTKGLRDPFLIRSHEGDKFWILATDLSIGSGTSWAESARKGSRYLEIWESNDLVTWSAQRHVLVSPDTAGNTWAPEAYYDTAINKYVVYWASSLYDKSDTAHTGPTYHRMLYATTTDFKTFSEPKVWQDAGTSRIDSTVIEVGGTYYRFTKDEGGAASGCTDIIEESSKDLLAELKGWTSIATCIGKKAGTQAIEGPTVFKSNPGDTNGDKFYLFVDEYGGRGYIPLETADISKPAWKVAAKYKLPKNPRHGTVVQVTAAELNKLNSAKPKIRRDDHEELPGDVPQKLKNREAENKFNGDPCRKLRKLGRPCPHVHDKRTDTQTDEHEAKLKTRTNEHEESPGEPPQKLKNRGVTKPPVEKSPGEEPHRLMNRDARRSQYEGTPADPCWARKILGKPCRHGN